MRQVWMVSSGEYSDYRVRYICPTAEAANEVAACINGTYVEEAGWCESADDLRANRQFRLTISVDFSASGERNWRETFDDVDGDEPIWSHAYEWQPRYGGRVAVHGTDHVRVRKVASEMSAKFLAELNDRVDFDALKAEADECRELEALIAAVKARTVDFRP
jgi:hypothetical protein